jgi:hypothetical protein
MPDVTCQACKRSDARIAEGLKWARVGAWVSFDEAVMGRIVAVRDPSRHNTGIVAVMLHNKLVIVERTFEVFFSAWMPCACPYETPSVWERIVGEDWI